MGISGLETFIDSLYQESPRNGAFREKPLKEIKLVIDGNQLPHILCNELCRNNEHGGNYDQIYQVTKSLLTTLKPFIGIIIFDGSKENAFKAEQRFNQKIEKVANLKTRYNQPSQADHFQVLRNLSPLFSRMILYKVTNELKIEYKMSDGEADHAVACFANGHNPTGEKYTVLSRDSYFNVYKLDKGYLSLKYFSSYLRDLGSLNEETKVPIYNLNNLLEYLRLKSYKSWFYFCVILGDIDMKIARNNQYVRENRIDTRKGQFIRLVDHFRVNERNSQLDANMILRLKSYYSEDDLNKIDEMNQKFEFIDTEYFFSEISSPDDFDRFILSLKDSSVCYFPCYVEDTSENSVFRIAINILENIYYSLDCGDITEYTREIITDKVTSQKYVFKRSKFQAYISTVNFLTNLNRSNQDDNLAVLFLSLSEWYKWLNKNNYNKRIEIDPKDFIDSVFNSWILISLKSKPKPSSKRSFNLLKDLFQSDENYTEIVDIYNLIINNNNNSNYFDRDFQLVHRINEFQAVYFLLNVYCRVKEYKFEFYSPDEFLNGLFVCKFIQERNIPGSKSNRLNLLLNNNRAVQTVLENMKHELRACLDQIGENELVNMMRSINIV